MFCIKNNGKKMKTKLLIMFFYVSSFVFTFQHSLETFIINYNEKLFFKKASFKKFNSWWNLDQSEQGKAIVKHLCKYLSKYVST